MLKSSLVTLLFLFISVAASAHQSKRGKITGTVGPFFYQSFPGTQYTGAENPLLEGFTLVAEGGVDKNGGLEIGLTYMHQLYFREQGEGVIVEKVKRIHAFTGYRHWFNPSLSVAAAFYNAYSMGDVAVVHRYGSLHRHFKTTAREIADDGLDFSVQYEFARKKKTAIIIDLRYSYSFDAQSGEVPDVYGVFIGFKQFIQARDKGADLLSR